MIKEIDLEINRGKISEAMNTEQVFTIKDLLEYYNISRVYFYNLITAGKLPKPVKKIGRVRVYTKEVWDEIKGSGVLNHRVLEE